MLIEVVRPLRKQTISGPYCEFPQVHSDKAARFSRHLHVCESLGDLIAKADLRKYIDPKIQADIADVDVKSEGRKVVSTFLNTTERLTSAQAFKLAMEEGHVFLDPAALVTYAQRVPRAERILPVVTFGFTKAGDPFELSIVDNPKGVTVFLGRPYLPTISGTWLALV